MRLSLAALLLAGTAPLALAAESPPSGSEEVVVTAPLEGARIESLQGATVLRRDAIVARLNTSLGELLSGLPGISSTFYGAGAGRPIIRGLGDDRIRVLENGIGTIDASSASPDHAVGADPVDARRIEVLRGAAALAYGGNAVGGVVNVIDETIPTKLPEHDVGARGLAAWSSAETRGKLSSGTKGMVLLPVLSVVTEQFAAGVEHLAAGRCLAAQAHALHGRVGREALSNVADILALASG